MIQLDVAQPSQGANQSQPNSSYVRVGLSLLTSRANLTIATDNDALDTYINDQAPGFDKLLKLEKQLNHKLHVRRRDLQESLLRPSGYKHTLRIQVSHVCVAPGELLGAESNTQTAWTMKIQGKLLKQGKHQKPFSAQLKSIMVELQGDVEDPVVQAKFDNQSKHVDGFEIKRQSARDLQAQIHLDIAHEPELLCLTDGFARLLNIKQDTYSSILQAVWAYIRRHSLQSEVDRRQFQVDAALCAALKLQIAPKTLLPLSEIPTLVDQGTMPMPFVVLKYNVTLDTRTHSKTFDVDIWTDGVLNAMQRQTLEAYENDTRTKQLLEAGSEITRVKTALHLSLQKRRFLSDFAQDPKGTIEDWLHAQSRDMEIMLGRDIHGVPSEDRRKADFWKGKWIDEAVVAWNAQRVDQARAR